MECFYVLIILWIHIFLPFLLLNLLLEKCLKTIPLQIIFKLALPKFLFVAPSVRSEPYYPCLFFWVIKHHTFFAGYSRNHNPLSVHWVTLACGLFVAFVCDLPLPLYLPLLTIAILRAVQYGKEGHHGKPNDCPNLWTSISSNHGDI